MAVCRACKQEIAIAHCESPSCTWCRGRADRKREESEAVDKRKGIGQ